MFPYMNQTSGHVVEIAAAPFASAFMTSSFSWIRPPQRTGTLLMEQIFLTILGTMMPGRISIISGWESRFSRDRLSMLKSARLSITKYRSTVTRPISLACVIRFAFVVMMPSALVYLRIKSIETSWGLSPVTRSIWTIAIFPASFTLATMSAMVQMSPNKMNTASTSEVRQISSPSFVILDSCYNRGRFDHFNKFSSHLIPHFHKKKENTVTTTGDQFPKMLLPHSLISGQTILLFVYNITKLLNMQHKKPLFMNFYEFPKLIKFYPVTLQ